MANPLYGRKPPVVAPVVAQDENWEDPVGKAFSVTVKAGWAKAGGLKTFERGLRYIVFDLGGPEGAVVFWPDPGLPLRALVPGHWHGPMAKPSVGGPMSPLFPMPWLTPLSAAPAGHVSPHNLPFHNPVAPWELGKVAMPAPASVQRQWFGERDAAQRLYFAPYTAAENIWQALMWQRFGATIAVDVKPAPLQAERIRSQSLSANLAYRRVDACTAEFTSADGQKRGCVHLSTFGGDQPGETWDCDFISGYFGPVSNIDAVRACYDKAATTLSTDRASNNDLEKAGKTAHDTAVANRQWLFAETEAGGREREQLDAIRKRAVDHVKAKRNAEGI